MRKKANGCTSSTRSGVQGTLTGTCTMRRRICSCTSRTRTSSSSRVTSTTARFVPILALLWISCLNLRCSVQLTYDCAAPPSTDFEVAIGPMASAAGSPRICSLRTIKSDVVVGLGKDGDELAERLDKEEPGWKISGKYVSIR